MTAIVAVSNGRFSVVAADTLVNEGNDRHFCRKLRRVKCGKSSIVLAGSGETGPLWRRAETDPKWQAFKSSADVMERVVEVAQATYEDKQVGGASPGEGLMVVSSSEILLTDNSGTRMHGARIKGYRATIEADGSGRAFVLAYVLGHLSALTPRQARSVLNSRAKLSDLLRAAVSRCAHFDSSVGGDVDVMVVS